MPDTEAGQPVGYLGRPPGELREKSQRLPRCPASSTTRSAGLLVVTGDDVEVVARPIELIELRPCELALRRGRILPQPQQPVSCLDEPQWAEDFTPGGGKPGAEGSRARRSVSVSRSSGFTR